MLSKHFAELVPQVDDAAYKDGDVLEQESHRQQQRIQIPDTYKSNEPLAK